jgi:hypothetical protein
MSHTPSYITGVTGGGAMPSTVGAPVAACAGNGSTDDTSCLQNAINAAAAAKKPLLIPATSSYYRITNRLTVSTSLIGTGGRPTIRTTNTSSAADGSVLRLARGMTGWIYNLHLVGTFTGSGSGEWAHNIDVGAVSGVTIKGNLLENAAGDAVGNDVAAVDGGTVTNVIVANNTMRNPHRCAVAFVTSERNWVVMDNVIDKQVNYVSGIDVEPEAGWSVQNVEIGYNKFVMNNRTANPNRGADGKAVSGWRASGNNSPGGNYYVHHNYGTFGSGFGSFDGGGWGYILETANAEGTSPRP